MTLTGKCDGQLYDFPLMIYILGTPAMGPPVTTIKINVQNLYIDTTNTDVAISYSSALGVKLQNQSKDNDLCQM
jgi:hypothetical protein